MTQYESEPGETGWPTPGPVRSACGGLVVETTPQGLPTSVIIEDGQLRRDPGLLAADILRLVRRSALLSETALRARLLDSGVTRDVVDQMGLASGSDLAELDDLDDVDALAEGSGSSSWLRKA